MTFTEKYENLLEKIENFLRNKVETSKEYSDIFNSKRVNVELLGLSNIDHYKLTEVIVTDGNINFVDERALCYDINGVDLEQLCVLCDNLK